MASVPSNRVGPKFPTGVDPLVIERHIFLIHDQPTHTLLTMPRRKLVPQLWPPCLADQNLDQGLVVFGVTDHHFIDVPGQRGFISHRRVFIWDRRGLTGECVVVGVRRRLLVHVDVPRINPFPNTGEPVQLNDIILFLNRAILVERCIRESVETSDRFRNWKIPCRNRKTNLRAIGIFSDEGRVLPQYLTSSIATVQTCLEPDPVSH